MAPITGTTAVPKPLTAAHSAALGNQLEDLRVITRVIRDFHPNLSPDEIKPIHRRLEFHLNQLRASFPDISMVRGKKILDIACGSRNYEDDTLKRFEPWMCRLLLHLGATPVGVDRVSQRTEEFESHIADLTVPDALSCVKPPLFDGVYISGFPTCKAIEHLDSIGLTWPTMRENILYHARRLLKPGGIIIRQFDAGDEELVRLTLEKLRIAEAARHPARETLHMPSPWGFDDEDTWFYNSPRP